MRIHYVPLWFCALTLAIGCQPAKTPDPADFGRFEGDVIASWNDDGRNMTLRENFGYVDARNRLWAAPAGSVVNGASIPAAFWTFIGGPFEGKYRNASVVHDVACSQMTATWEDVHSMFYEACRCGGVDETMAKMLYYAVYHFGPRWRPVTETRVETRTNADGRVVQEQVAVHRMVRLDPPPPTLEEVGQVEALIVEENPGRSIIERTNRDAIHRRPRRGSGHGPTGHGSRIPSSSLDGVDRIARKRPDGIPGPYANGGNPTVGVGGRVATGGELAGRRNPHEGWGGQPGQRPARPQNAPALPALTPPEQQWAAQQVRQHLEQQAGQGRPAEYTVERTEGGYRIFVQYLQLDEQGRPTSYAGGSTVSLSRDGQVLEMINAM